MKTLAVCFLLFVSLIVMQCATKTAPTLPKDILGVSVGMPREDAVKRLRQVGKYQRNESNRTEIWLLIKDPSFGHLIIKFNEEEKVDYVSVIAKVKDAQPVRYDTVGDLGQAKQESVGAFHRYIWEVPAQGNDSAYFATAQGNDAENLSIYTLTNSLTLAGEDDDEPGEKK